MNKSMAATPPPKTPTKAAVAAKGTITTAQYLPLLISKMYRILSD